MNATDSEAEILHVLTVDNDGKGKLLSRMA
jgi:hypothetical protein